MNNLRNTDPEIFSQINNEQERQEHHIELIASENYASKACMEAQGSCLTNKYAEGYSGKRYYGGCEFVDNIESLAVQRAMKLFDATYANVQPHSGSQANAAVYQAILRPGDAVLGMKLDHGGHLTHGSAVNFSGKNYNFIGYGLNDDGFIDYSEVRKLAVQHKPKLIVAGFSAYSKIANWTEFRNIADEVGALLMVDMAHVAGLVAAGLYPNPLDVADVVTSTTHKTLGGPRGGLILARNNQDIGKKINSAIFPGIQGGPLMHVIAAKAVAFKEAMSEEFTTYQSNVLNNAQRLSRKLSERGYKIVSNGTESHMFLVDLQNKELTGKEAEHLLGLANITLNKNSVPNDPQSPFVTSGLRIGVPAVTRRGFGLDEMDVIGDGIADILDSKGDESVILKVKEKMLNICRQYPVY
ncbi:serine hydroxymethyltransferase (plasmid) [Vibrio parahaemolyticus]|uniref:serine hydroxymethyltransferase n=1 Tax=Vibrio TaxID=662 RepID=UPI0005F26913|nr:serine hydroxymethyltransferase [Vibrio parahaemolyticus]EJG0766487.1 serine hydroxymethyltransferase [Vibrio parahaemolyticus O5:K30]HAT8520074.1 aminotransferase class I/II-fold pyridoxal phosphate-dependent enzyme [Vibrio vulnificus]EGR2220897.1 serine hydroxymethyltransferase [Vibrio parahaemolyticus]MBE4202427.1 serine hydroxymethyltransferase [Vibrio parahaemolyticus]WMN81425.1 serine hydroxymethyltransferase [Vibrio parahaemolyticus]